MAKAASALLLLGLILYCASVSSAQTADNHLQDISQGRSLQQEEQFADAPGEQDVSTYLQLVELAAAAGLDLDDLLFDSSLDEKAPPVQLPQPPTPTLLRLLSRMAAARGNPAYEGPGLPGPNFPGFGAGRPSSISAAEAAAAFDAATGGFGPPGSNQPYQLPERFRHYLETDPVQLPSPPEQQQQEPGYTLESGELSSPDEQQEQQQQQQQQQQEAVITPQISSLITKLAGRGRKFGTNPGGVSHEMIHASIPRLESAPIGPPSLDAAAMQQLAEQPGLLTAGSRIDNGRYPTNAATEQLLAELVGLDPTLARQQFASLLNKGGGRSASVSEVTTKKQYIPRQKATPLAPGGSAAADGSGQDAEAGALQQPYEQQQDQELMDGRDGHSAYGRIATDNVVLADPREIDRDAGKVAAAHADQPVEVDILQVDPATLAALEQNTPQTFDQIQDEAAAVAAAAAADPVPHRNGSAQKVEQVTAANEPSSSLMPGSEGLESGSSAAGSSKGSRKGLDAGTATGIALGVFGVVLLGVAALLFVQARKMEKDADSGYTPAAQTEADLELANQKPPAICISPAVSMGGAAVSSGGAATATAAAAGEPLRRFTLNGRDVDGAADPTGANIGVSSNGAGWIRRLVAAAAASAAASSSSSSSSSSGAVAHAAGPAAAAAAAAGVSPAPVTQPPAAAGDIRRFTLTSDG